ncbi:hypothetical protein KIW84_040139 [Lathyrus oleraceus]|uniref:PB1-like domain-containing protein n=1 Tax=Pisum sativum TaxID=3888 RepID=A0A9D4X4F7_PEA|nr:hypothetical protein KIW84_040139 [Pisum sativum]
MVQSRWCEDTYKLQMSQMFNVIFHHGGEFVRLNDGDTIYNGGVSTRVYEQLIDKWSMVNIHKLVNGWGYIEGAYKIWTKILDIDGNFFQIRNNDDACNFAAYTCATEVDGEMFVKHDVTGIEVIVNIHRCLNGMVELDGRDDEGVEGFNDSVDERTTAIADGFDGIDVPLPINEGTIVAGLLTGSKKKKWKDDKHVSDEQNNSDPDVSDDDNGSKFEKFRKGQLNKNFKFKWGM